MRIVFLNPTGAPGGGERSLLDLIASLRDCNASIEPHLIACEHGPLAAAASREGATVDVLPMPDVLLRLGDHSGGAGAATRQRILALGHAARAGVAALRFARRLRDAVAAARPDVVHSNGMKTHVLSGLAPPVGVPLVWHVRDLPSARAASHLLLRRAARCRPAVIAVSRAVAEDVRSVLRDDAVTIHVIPNGIDTHHFSPAPSPANVADRELCVGLVATYARWKGHDLFLDAARIVRGRAPHARVRFRVIGGPIYHTSGSQVSREELLQLVARHALGDAVEFIPFQDDPVAAYRALDVVVHASTRPEPFGRAIAEAMSCGRAVVVSNEGGAAELIRDGHDALAFRPRDANALADAILRLLDDAPLRARLGAAARRAAVDRFDRKRLGGAVLEVYRQLTRSLSP